jgi:REP element-mobilizing transposase RayT
MRPLRLLAPCDPQDGFPVLYHIASRVIEKQFIFNDRERAKFLKLAKDFAVFSGFELVSWCLMSNHFHLLVRVPVQDVEAISDEEMVDRLSRILNPKRLSNLVARLNGAPTSELRRPILADFRKRIGHLPSYVKAVKQEFTQWFNHKNQREGTLWEGRYHSTLIEDTGGGNPQETLNGSGEIARIVASYIDMNPVRANVEADPKDSDWSSYGAALRGDPTARRGLRILWGNLEGLPAQTDRDRSEPSRNPAPREESYLDLHRRWILRRQAGGDAEENGASSESAQVTRAEIPEPPSRRPGIRPLATGSLRSIRLLGSPEFQNRFGAQPISHCAG